MKNDGTADLSLLAFTPHDFKLAAVSLRACLGVGLQLEFVGI
jgi:hypothetical protein